MMVRRTDITQFLWTLGVILVLCSGVVLNGRSSSHAVIPTNSNINDTFGGGWALLDPYKLYVFDRWGGIIFQSMDMAVRWDGTMDGEEVMNGVYPFKYVVKGLKMSLKQGFGHIVLIR